MLETCSDKVDAIGLSTRKVDPRVKRTRQLLQQAFWELMHEKGFSAISIQDVAERATVNRATFYAHFDDKYQLLDSIVQEQFHQRVTKDLPNPQVGRKNLTHPDQGSPGVLSRVPYVSSISVRSNPWLNRQCNGNCIIFRHLAQPSTRNIQSQPDPFQKNSLL